MDVQAKNSSIINGGWFIVRCVGSKAESTGAIGVNSNYFVVLLGKEVEMSGRVKFNEDNLAPLASQVG